MFRMSPSGADYRLLHTFTGSQSSGGSASLIAVKGTLFGTTPSGGAFHAGIVFSISTNGEKFRVLHNFGKGSDGAYPSAGLIAVNGMLYGATGNGGSL